jgi:peptidoglycan/xylan/chitin deacetylase (PgdA/CDA1 family)
LPGQLYEHYTKGTPLPAKPVMLTFDDTHEGHYSMVAGILDKYHFKGAFFIMTVSIGKKNYLTAQQIRTLSEKGHAIECHTYDHPSLTSLTGKQWAQQIDKPRRTLENITGNPVEYFAYPFGLWNEAAALQLKDHGIKAAFQLTGKRSETMPLYSIRRMLVPGNWSAQKVVKYMAATFKQN